MEDSIKQYKEIINKVHSVWDQLDSLAENCSNLAKLLKKSNKEDHRIKGFLDLSKEVKSVRNDFVLILTAVGELGIKSGGRYSK